MSSKVVLTFLVSLQITFIIQAATFGIDQSMLETLDATRNALLAEMPLTKVIQKSRPMRKNIFKEVTAGITTFSVSGKGIGILGAGRWNRKRESKVVHNKKKTKQVKKVKRVLYNKYLQAINQVEKGILEAGAMQQRQRRSRDVLTKLKDSLKKACKTREYVFARQMLGHAVYEQTAARSRTGRKRRQASSSANNVISDIKASMGQDEFTKLMALDGGVTLAFAIDTTGSMYTEIQGAKKIATDIINTPRSFDVDYILSPFSDNPGPDVTPATYKSSEEKKSFIELIGKLKARGGGDCPEEAIEGIQKIYTASPKFDSPVYVFTDAGAKDASADNLELLIDTAYNFYYTPINFFLSNSGCLKDKDIELYRYIANETGGEVLLFGRGSQLKEMSTYVKNALVGGVPIPVEPNQVNGRKRRSTEKSYSILVDDSIDTLSASVITIRTNSNVELTNPKGHLQLSGKTSTGQGSLYLVNKPSPGIWSLTVSSSTGNELISVRGTSEENIDFDYYFITEVLLGRRRKKPVISKSPIKGQKVDAVITISGHEKILPSTLKLMIMDNNMRLTETSSMKPYGTTKGRYGVSFKSPTRDFMFVLTGKTKSGNKFQRLARSTIVPTTALIHTMSAPGGFVVETGNRRGTTIMLAVHNFGEPEYFKIKILDNRKFAQRLISTRAYVIKGRLAFVPVRYVAPRNTKKGVTHKSVVVAEGEKSKVKTSIPIALLVL